jgi:hypothetical protein
MVRSLAGLELGYYYTKVGMMDAFGQNWFYAKRMSFLKYAALFLSFLSITTFFAHRMRDFRDAWAEDGVLYLAMLSDFGNLFAPIADAFLLLTNFLAMVAVTINLGAAPIIGSILACSAAAFLACYIQRSTFDWLLPSGGLRYVLALLVLLSVGAGETVGNLICLSYICALTLVLLILERPLSNRLAWYASWLFLCVSSSLAFLAFPIPLILFFIKREWRFLVIALVPLLTTALAPFLARNVSCYSCQYSVITLVDGIELVASTFVSYWLLLPLFGGPPFLGVVLNWPDVVHVAIALGMFCVFFTRFFKLEREKKALVFGLVLCSIGYSLAHKVGRTYHQDPFFLNGMYNPLRSTFLHLIFATLGWIILLTEFKKKKHAYGDILITVMMLQSLLGAIIWRITLPAPSIMGDWSTFASAIKIATKSENSSVNPELRPNPSVDFPPVYDQGSGINEPWAKVRCDNLPSTSSGIYGVRCLLTGGHGKDVTYVIPASSKRDN